MANPVFTFLSNADAEAESDALDSGVGIRHFLLGVGACVAVLLRFADLGVLTKALFGQG